MAQLAEWLILFPLSQKSLHSTTCTHRWGGGEGLWTQGQNDQEEQAAAQLSVFNIDIPTVTTPTEREKESDREREREIYQKKDVRSIET